MDDWKLLQEYVQSGSRAALDELVRRHVGMVYAAAWRQVGDAHLAEDVTQAVFIILMRRARRISSKVVLGGWLFQVTRYAAADFRKQNLRRRRHEEQAAVMKQMSGGTDVGDRDRLMVELDEAVGSLSPTDRDAVVMKYLEGKSAREVGEVQGISEPAARQRLFRALAKMREYMVRKKIAVTEEALGAALAAPAQVKMVELAARITASLHGPVAASQAVAIAHSTLKGIIMMTKIKIAAAVAVLVCVCLGGVAVVHYEEFGTRNDNPDSWTVNTQGTHLPPAPVNPPVRPVAGGLYWQGYPTRAPFIAVIWRGAKPSVQVGGNWYDLTAIDSIPVERIIAFDRSLPQDGVDNYRKHFQEDLVEILSRMGHAPGGTVELSVTDPGSGQAHILKDVAMTEENRRTLLENADVLAGVNNGVTGGAGQRSAIQPSPAVRGGNAGGHTAPFTGMRWVGDTTQVRVEQTWYELIALDGVSADKIVQFAKETYPDGDASHPMWKKRMSEDLVEVLSKMGHPLKNTVSLDLQRLGGGEKINMPRVAMTDENRRMILEANNGAGAQGGGAAASGRSGAFASGAPFTAVRWMDATPWVKVNGTWYEFLGVDDISVKKIVDAAKVKYPDSTWPGWWRRQFLQTFGRVVGDAGGTVGDSVTLSLRNLGTNEMVTLRNVQLTRENQQQAMQYMRSSPFTAVRWADNVQQVQVNHVWYEFISMDDHTVAQLDPSFRDSAFASRETWMYFGWTPGDTVNLKLRKIDTHEEVTLADVAVTAQNLQLGGVYMSRSPFTGVRWNDATPEVQVNGTWYELVSVNHHAAGLFTPPEDRKLQDFLTLTLGGPIGLGDSVGDSVNLELRTLDTKQPVTMADVPMTVENHNLSAGWVQAPGTSDLSGWRAGPLLGKVRWAGLTPQVELNGTWYELIAIDDVPVTEIVSFAQKQYGGDWKQSQFAERTEKVMGQFGHNLFMPPRSIVILELKTLDTGESVKIVKSQPSFARF
jgi:RNA polymerase sigma factor (sigma-70 family)